MNAQNRIGQYEEVVTGEERFRAYIPPPLPPDPPLQLGARHFRLIELASGALGHLDGLTTLLPDPRLFLYMYVRKEAVLSSQIEGTQSSLSDLLLYEQDEAPGVPLVDVEEVSHYLAALQHGLQRLRGGFPFSSRLIREIHGKLLSGGRGSEKDPGHFRRSQNWIGGTRPGNAVFVPPPPERVADFMGRLEEFVHDDSHGISPLIKAALVHVQFESIHPFLDGNGRVGRLLIALLLCTHGVLQDPILYLSLYFKENRQLYYEHLQRVRTHGDWEGWLIFFLEGVSKTAEEATATGRAILAVFDDDRKKMFGTGNPPASVVRVHDLLRESPIISASRASEQTGLSRPTVRTALNHLERLGIVREITGRKRGRLFAYKEYLDIVSAGTAPSRT